MKITTIPAKSSTNITEAPCQYINLKRVLSKVKLVKIIPEIGKESHKYNYLFRNN